MDVKNDRYEIRTDKAKNRIYLSIVGFWASPADVPNYVSDLDKASKELKNGFTVVTDTTRMKPPANELNAVHEEAQKLLIRAGLSHTAEIVADKDKINKMSVNQFSKKSGMAKEIFGTLQDAEKWLDS